MAANLSELKAARDTHQEQMRLRTFVLRSALPNFQRVFLDNGLASRLRSITETAEAQLAPNLAPEATATDVNARDAQGKPTTVSQLALDFLASTEQQVLLLRCRDETVAQRTSTLLLGLQWASFKAHAQTLPLAVDLSQHDTVVGDVVREALLQRGYCAAAADALHRENPGLLLVVQQWQAQRHCTNIYARGAMAKWTSVTGAAPKVIFVVCEEQLAAARSLAKQPAGSEDVDCANPRFWGSGPEGTVGLYFMPSDVLGQPLPSALTVADAVSASDAAPLNLAEKTGSALALAASAPPAVEKAGSRTRENKPTVDRVDVKSVIGRCNRALLRVRGALCCLWGKV